MLTRNFHSPIYFLQNKRQLNPINKSIDFQSENQTSWEEKQEISNRRNRGRVKKNKKNIILVKLSSKLNKFLKVRARRQWLLLRGIKLVRTIRV